MNTPNQLDGRTELQPHLFFRLYLADRIGHTYGIIPTQSTGESLQIRPAEPHQLRAASGRQMGKPGMLILGQLHIARPMPSWIAGQFHSHSTVVVGLYDDGGHVWLRDFVGSSSNRTRMRYTSKTCSCSGTGINSGIS